MQVREKVIVITGAASGLGLATARYMVERGARVVLLDVNTEAGEAAVAELGHDRALFACADITDEEAVRRALEAAVAKFGAIHVCINCAALLGPCKVLGKDGKATPLARYAQIISVNLIGLFNVMSKSAERMALNEPEAGEERGVIINISSGAAYEGQIGQCAYSSSKAGVIGLNMPAARELAACGIRVNAIAPGLFLTPMAAQADEKVIAALLAHMVGPKRLGDMREFAHTCAYIIENSYLNAETIRLDAAARLPPR
jgi:3-hydroxyacyl-CoA dehydrogenase / 3-hydroxy-2-methylbutyryl-CoA dehydrogenase